MSLLARDSFQRSNQSGFGTASDGESWSHIDGAGTESIVSNEGQITSANDTNVTTLGSKTIADTEMLVRLSVSSTNARAGLLGRVADANNYYFARINGSTNTVQIEKCVAGTNTLIAGGSFTPLANTFYWLKFRLSSTTLSAKAWKDGNSEPGSWTVTTTDSSISAAGQFGLYSLVASTSTTVKYDSFTALSLTDTLDVSARAGVRGGLLKDVAARANVQAPFTPTLATDTFVRANQANWGVASDGETWAQIDGKQSASIVSNAGQVTGATGSAIFTLGIKQAPDVDLKVRAFVTGTSGDRMGVLGRVQDATTQYRIYWAGGGNLTVANVNANTVTVLATSAFSVTASTYYWIRGQIISQTNGNVVLKAKIWQDGSGEPGSWTITVTDTNPLTGTGQHGIYLFNGAVGNTPTANNYTAIQLTVPYDIAARARLAGLGLHDWNARANIANISHPGGPFDITARVRVAGLGLLDMAARACLEEAVIGLPSFPPSQITIQLGTLTISPSPGYALRAFGAPVNISGATLPALSLLDGSLSLGEDLSGRSTCQFTLTDTTGMLHIPFRERVQVQHSVQGIIFNGFVNTSQEANLPPNAANQLQITCVDEHYLADKMAYKKDEFVDQYAGDIASFLANELANEGVVTSYAIDYDTTVEDFGEGTLVSVVPAANIGTTNIGDGDLELSPAGLALTITEETLSDFQSGTLTNAQANGVASIGNLSPTSFYAIKFTGQATVTGGGNLYVYQKIWSGSHVVGVLESLQYDIWISSTSPTFQAGIDIVFSDGTTLRDTFGGQVDQQGISPDPRNDLSSLAKDQWYTRNFELTQLGKTIQYIALAFEGDNLGTYTAYFRRVYLTNPGGLNVVGGSIKTVYFDGPTLNVSPAQQIQNSGYANVNVSVVTAYEPTGMRVSPVYDLSSVGIARSSLISWDATFPLDSSGKAISGMTLLIEASLDGGATWRSCTKNQPLPNLLAGLLLPGRSLLLRETITNATPDPTQTIFLNDVQVSFSPSFAGTKQDIVTTTTTLLDWLNGNNFTGAIFVSSAGISLNGHTINWDATPSVSNAQVGNITKWSGGTLPQIYLVDKQLTLQVESGYDVRAQLTDVSNFTDFICEVDISITFADTAENVGIVYRTGTNNWQNNDHTYAYSAYVNASQIVLAHGTNSSSGAGTYTQIASQSLTLSTGNVHRLKVVVSGNSHNLYLDDVLYVSATDSTYPSAGGVGLRYSNQAGILTLNTTITSGVAITTISVASIPVDIPDATKLTVDFGGAHPEVVYAFGKASAASGVTTIQITTNSFGSVFTQAAWTPGFTHTASAKIQAFLLRTAVFDNFGIATGLTGARYSMPIDLSSAGILQSSMTTWNATIPAGSVMLVEASIDGGTTWQACSNGGALPVLTSSQSLSGVSLTTRITLTVQSVTTLPTVSGFTVWIVGQLQASGYRISPPLALAPVGRVGDSLVAWTANLPNDDTTLGVDVSPDGVNWTDVSYFNGKSVPFIESFQDPPYTDTFASDQTASYTASALTGGTAALWMVNTVGSVLTSTGGTHAFISPNSQVLADGEIIFDMDQADNGGCMWRLSSDFSSCYELSIQDGSSAQSPNRLRLFKVASGQRTQLAPGATLNFPRGTPVRFKVVHMGNTITVTANGGMMQSVSYTDPTPLAEGLVALRSSGGTNRYYQLRVQEYGDDVSQSTLYTRLRLATTDPLYTPQVENLTVAVHGQTISNGALIPATTYSILSGSTNTIAQDFDDLAKQSNYWWRILQGVLYFQSQAGIPSPIVLTGTDMLYGSQVQVTRSPDLYRNQQIIIGGTDVEARAETATADGFLTSFQTGEPIESVLSILVGGLSQSFGLKGIDTGKNWYYQQGKQGITQDPNALPLTAATQITINYNGQIHVIAQADHLGQQAILAALDGTSGLVTVVEKAGGLTRAAAVQLALSRLNQYAVLTIDLQFTTTRPGLHIGQLLTVFLPQHGLTNQTFLITKVDYQPNYATKSGQGDMVEYYKVQATNGAVLGSWTHLFGG